MKSVTMSKLSFVFIIIVVLFISCNNIKLSKIGNLPEEFPLKVGNTWIYKKYFYSNNDTTCTVDTLCVLGKYEDYYKYSGSFGRFELVNNQSGKFLSYGYIQLADTIHGNIVNGDSIPYPKPIIFKADTVLFERPRILAIFTADTGYVDIDTAKYTFVENSDSFHVSIKKGYEFQNNTYDAYVYRYKAACPGIYCRFSYYTGIGVVYESSILQHTRKVGQEIFLERFIENHTMKNIKISDHAECY